MLQLLSLLSHFPAFGLNTERYKVYGKTRIRKNADQNNSEYGHFSHSATGWNPPTNIRVKTALKF